MEKKVIRQRMRGLLALVLAFVMMFGTSMTVFAQQDYVLGVSLNQDELKEALEGKILYGGDTIARVSGSQINVYMPDGYILPLNNYVGGNYKAVIGGTESDRYTARCEIKDGWYCIYLSYYREPELIPQENSQSGAGSGHKHYYQWRETLEATATSDGLLENICECGAVNDRVVVPGAMAYFKQFCERIQNAPEGSTVEWNPLNNRCYTRRMMEELAKRPDVTLKTVYTEPDGSKKSFTIPAGGAPADGELFYGFTYLGNLYGWN